MVSATPTSTNQNSWLAEMRKALPQHPGLEIVSVVYGDDVSDKSYREAVALLKQHPDLVVLVSISSVGIVASARAVEDKGLTGKVKVTGLGLPSELVGYVRERRRAEVRDLESHRSRLRHHADRRAPGARRGSRASPSTWGAWAR